MNVSVAVILFISLIAILGVANIGVKRLTKDVKSSKVAITISVTPTLSNITPTTIKQENLSISKTNTQVSPTAAITKNLNTFKDEFNLDLKYPNSVVLESSNELILESEDDPETITNWYKGKIQEMGLRTKSFVQTRANDAILNKLSGANSDKEINVEISKNGNSKVKIKVNVKIPIDNEKTF